jgi:molybdenum cofactor guanylyltransferase
VPDIPSEYAGPLAGVAAAIDWCNRAERPPDFLLTAAVDTPFLPADFAARMLEALGPDAPAVIARYDRQEYPTNALWRLSAIADLPARVADGTAPRSLRRLAEQVGASFLDWPATPAGDPFANVNTPADLAALEARASRGN